MPKKETAEDGDARLALRIGFHKVAEVRLSRLVATFLVLLIPAAAGLGGERPDADSTETVVPPPGVIRDLPAYAAECRADPGRRMVDLRQEVPGLVFDIRYATRHNFTGEALYDSPGAYLRAGAAARLREVEADLRGRGLGLKVFDAYRPYSVTVRMWLKRGPNGYFVAPAQLGSDHNRGVAVDVSLVRLADGRELAMPSDFDFFGPQAGQAFMELPGEEIANRATLRAAMERHGFHSLDQEWWHYALHGAKEYSLLDLPFSAFQQP